MDKFHSSIMVLCQCRVPDFDHHTVVALREFLVSKKGTLKYLGVEGHHICNLLFIVQKKNNSRCLKRDRQKAKANLVKVNI